MMETSVLVTIAIFAIGVAVTAGRLLERQANTRRDLQKLEGSVSRELGEIKRVLFTTIGGRRAIKPIEGLAEPAEDGEYNPG